MDAFLTQPLERQRVVYEEAGRRLGLSAGSVEKDLWVCWTLRALFRLPVSGPHLTFKGGTSLSKGWKLIDRFSEDIDIVIDREFLGFGGADAPEDAPSNKQREKRLDGLKLSAQHHIRDVLGPALEQEIRHLLPSDLWLSYFYSYLNENGRAGVVMSSQASSAGRDEAVVRQKMVETGAVDVMIDIRGNFFYTRTVPCQLWFFDRAKERDDKRRDQVLMLDARNIYRKVSRAVYDFSPEQQQNIAAIVWLYRGQGERFLKLVESYIDQAVSWGVAAGAPLDAFAQGLDKLADLVQPFAAKERKPDPLAETWAELTALRTTLADDISALQTEVASRAKHWEKAGRDNAGLTVARKTLYVAPMNPEESPTGRRGRRPTPCG